MRRLWIERRKASAAAATAMNVYIEDPEEGDVIINDIPCRKLGVVKNGRKKRFTIEEDARKLFVVHKVGKKEHPFVQLSEGRDDVFVSGTARKKLFQGKSFWVEGMEEVPAQKNPGATKRLGTVILVLAILLGIGGGIFAGWKISDRLLNRESVTVSEAADKTFTAAGMEITLTDAFSEGSVPGYTACYSSDAVSVYVLREGFDSFEGFADMTVAGYGTMVLGNNGLLDTVELKEEGDRASFEHRYAAGDREYAYHCVLLKGPDAFWLVQIAVPGEAEESYAADVSRWAKSISFAD